MTNEKFSIGKRLKSFRFAFHGLRQFFRSTHNAIVHAFATAGVLGLAAWLKLPLSKLISIVIAIGLVWMAELFNTAIEALCDMVHPGQHPAIKYIKDLSAAAVLVTAIAAFVTACIIFIPEIL